MSTIPVPEFILGDDEPDLRAQVGWTQEQIGFEDSYFARLLHLDEETLRRWRAGEVSLSPERQEQLHDFWWMVRHLLYLAKYDEERLRTILHHRVPVIPENQRTSATPRWTGSSMWGFLQTGGPEAVDEVDRWVTSFWSGNPFID